MRFSDVIGGTSIIEKLRTMVDNDRLPHAVLFSEHPGCGAFPIVLALTQYLFCRRRNGKPGEVRADEGGFFGTVQDVQSADKQEKPTDSCGKCTSCGKVNNLVHPDVFFLFPINTTLLVEKGKKAPMDMYYTLFRELAKENPYFSEQDLYDKLGIENKLGIIGVSEAAWVMNKLSYSAYEGGDKVAIILWPERMNAEASNKLLKSIEEPGPGTFFFLVTNAPERIIKTIKSRCELIEIPPVPQDAIKEALEKNCKLSEEEAGVLAASVSGSYGRAADLAAGRENRKENCSCFMNMLECCREKDLPGLLSSGAEIAAGGKEGQRTFCKDSLEVIRTLYMLKHNMPQISYVNPADKEALTRVSKTLDEEFIKKSYEIFNNAMECIERNVNAKFIFCDLCNNLYLKF